MNPNSQNPYEQQNTEPLPPGSPSFVNNQPSTGIPPAPAYTEAPLSVQQQLQPQMPPQPMQQAPQEIPPMPFIEPALPNPEYRPNRRGVGKIFFIGLFIVIIALVSLWFVGPARQALVKAIGVTTSVRVQTVTPLGDNNQPIPLQKTTLKVNGTTVTTNSKGEATLSGLPYGPVTITATKDGYATATYRTTFEFSPFFKNTKTQTAILELKASGIPVTFTAAEWLSSKPITSGNFTIGDVTVQPNNKGVVTGNVPKDTKQVSIAADFNGSFIAKTFDVSLQATTGQVITFVPSGKQYYLSKDSAGIYSLYRSNLDGTDEEQVIKGTEYDTNFERTQIMISPNAKYGALRAIREADPNGQTVEHVYIVDLQTKKLTKVDQGAEVRFADWTDNIFSYVLVRTAADGGGFAMRTVDASNARVYNIDNGDHIIPMAGASGKLAYLVATNGSPDSPQLKVATIQGSNNETIGKRVPQETILQLSYGQIAFKSDADLAWHQYNLTNGQQKTITQPDVSLNDKISYIAPLSPDKTRRLFIKGSPYTYSLYVEDVTNNTQTLLLPPRTYTRSVRWFNSSIVLASFVTPEGTGDYAIPLDGSQPKKLRDWN